MEFFVCPCTATGRVMLDGHDQGPNKDGEGRLLTKQCNEGLHTVALELDGGRICFPALVQVEVKETDPICPMEIPFQCA